MTDREKLIEILLEVSKNIMSFPSEGFNEHLADHLIAHGVTIKEPQQPIAETKLVMYLDTPVWFEEFGRDVEYLPLLISGIGIYYTEFEEYGSDQRIDRRNDDYNHQWRCWAEKPTEEERKAAEWERPI